MERPTLWYNEAQSAAICHIVGYYEAVNIWIPPEITLSSFIIL
ncbi:MAG: hypothetical protein ABSE85_00305 [Candidatus Korobacteraceae bacterium]